MKKDRQQKPAPCNRKGIGNPLASNACECRTDCIYLGGINPISRQKPRRRGRRKKLKKGDYYQDDSRATVQHRENNPRSKFIGCYDIEQFLINKKLLRYDIREEQSLGVLFDGIKRVAQYTSDHINADSFEDISQEVDKVQDILTEYFKTMEEQGNYEDSRSTQPLFDRADNLSIEDREAIDENSTEMESETAVHNTKNSAHVDDMVSMISLLKYGNNTTRGYGNNTTREILSASPNSLYDLIFDSLYENEKFFNHNDNIAMVASCMYWGLDKPLQPNEKEHLKIVKKIWPDYNEIKFKEVKKAIDKTVFDSYPSWARKFESFMNKLTAPQREAIRCEYFDHNNELDGELTQVEKAKKLGIKSTAYKDRLEWAHIKFRNAYPELVKVPRRSKPNKKKKALPKEYAGPCRNIPVAQYLWEKKAREEKEAREERERKARLINALGKIHALLDQGPTIMPA